MFGKAHKYIYFIALTALVIALPTSKAFVNVMGGALFVNWLLEWNWKEKLNLLRENRLSLIFGAFFLAFALGFIATDVPGTSFRAWVSKIPFLLPIVVATTRKLPLKQQRFLLLAFSITVVVSAVLSIIIMKINGLHDIRDGGLFISHIRFSICAVLAVLIDFFFVLRQRGTLSVLCAVLGIVTILYLFIIQVFTGIILLLLFALCLFGYYLFTKKENRWRRWIMVGTCSVFCVVIVDFVYVTYQYFHFDKQIEKNLPLQTKLGHAYHHDVNSFVENGHKVGLFVCEEELVSAWQARSTIPYDSVSPTLVRYLNSKALTKDAEGVMALNAEDVKRIESGMANVDYAQKIGLCKMLYPNYFCFTLYQRDGTVFNSSVLQRVELWKNSWKCFLRSPWAGYGLGRGKEALNQQLDSIQSPLRRNMGCHNQFLSYLLMGGIPLLVLFLLFYFAPLFLSKYSKSIFYILFWSAIFLSLFAEDTLETGTGLYLFVFFSAFLLFGSDEALWNTDNLSVE